MKTTPIIIGSVAALLLAGGAAVLFSLSNYGPSLSKVRHLTTPRIAQLPAAKMLVIEATGEPDKTVGPAFGLLFKTYFKIKNRPKGNAFEGCRARWPKPLEPLFCYKWLPIPEIEERRYV